MAPLPDPGPSRRAVLCAVPAGAALVVLAGCRVAPVAAPATTPPLDHADAALRAAAVRREQDLLAGYDQVLTALPALAGRLAPLRAEHLVHLRALDAAAAPPARPPVGGVATGAAALEALRATERSAAAGHLAAVPTASAPLAALLASLAASEATHLLVLG